MLAFAVGLGLLLTSQLWLYLAKQQRGLRVLMYHKIRPSIADGLTVSTTQFAQQLQYLRTAGYTPISLSDLLTAHQQRSPLLRRVVLLTIDDAYADFIAHALPILSQYAMPATLFVPMAHIGGHNDWDGGTEPLLTADALHSLGDANVSLAYHSYRHENYKNLTISEIDADLVNCLATATKLTLPMQPAFAYPFGGRPRHKAMLRAMELLFRQHGIALAFRIGNRINGWPTRSAFFLNRIDVRGSDSLAAFRHKLRFGRIG